MRKQLQKLGLFLSSNDLTNKSNSNNKPSSNNKNSNSKSAEKSNRHRVPESAPSKSRRKESQSAPAHHDSRKTSHSFEDDFVKERHHHHHHHHRKHPEEESRHRRHDSEKELYHISPEEIIKYKRKADKYVKRPQSPSREETLSIQHKIDKISSSKKHKDTPEHHQSMSKRTQKSSLEADKKPPKKAKTAPPEETSLLTPLKTFFLSNSEKTSITNDDKKVAKKHSKAKEPPAETMTHEEERKKKKKKSTGSSSRKNPPDSREIAKSLKKLLDTEIHMEKNPVPKRMRGKVDSDFSTSSPTPTTDQSFLVTKPVSSFRSSTSSATKKSSSARRRSAKISSGKSLESPEKLENLVETHFSVVDINPCEYDYVLERKKESVVFQNYYQYTHQANNEEAEEPPPIISNEIYLSMSDSNKIYLGISDQSDSSISTKQRKQRQFHELKKRCRESKDRQPVLLTETHLVDFIESTHNKTDDKNLNSNKFGIYRSKIPVLHTNCKIENNSKTGGAIFGAEEEEEEQETHLMKNQQNIDEEEEETEPASDTNKTTIIKPSSALKNRKFPPEINKKPANIVRNTAAVKQKTNLSETGGKSVKLKNASAPPKSLKLKDADNNSNKRRNAVPTKISPSGAKNNLNSAETSSAISGPNGNKRRFSANKAKSSLEAAPGNNIHSRKKSFSLPRNLKPVSKPPNTKSPSSPPSTYRKKSEEEEEEGNKTRPITIRDKNKKASISKSPASRNDKCKKSEELSNSETRSSVVDGGDFGAQPRGKFERSSTRTSFGERSTTTDSITTAKNPTSLLLTKHYNDQDKQNRWMKRKLYADEVRRNLINKSPMNRSLSPSQQQHAMEVRFLTVELGTVCSAGGKSEGNYSDQENNDEEEELFDMPEPDKIAELVKSEKFSELFQSTIDEALDGIMNENYDFLKKDFSYEPVGTILSLEDACSNPADNCQGEILDGSQSTLHWHDFLVENSDEIQLSDNLDELYVNSDFDKMQTVSAVIPIVKRDIGNADSISAPGSEESGYSSVLNKREFFQKPEIQALLKYEPPASRLLVAETPPPSSSHSSCCRSPGSVPRRLGVDSYLFEISSDLKKDEVDSCGGLSVYESAQILPALQSISDAARNVADVQFQCDGVLLNDKKTSTTGTPKNYNNNKESSSSSRRPWFKKLFTGFGKKNHQKKQQKNMGIHKILGKGSLSAISRFSCVDFKKD